MRLIDADALKAYFFRPYSNEESYSNLDVANVIDAQPTALRWVRCEEEMPKNQNPVLVFVPPHEEYDDYHYGYVGMAYFTYSANGGFWCGTDGNLYGAVGMIHSPIAWMPIPEPPEEDA